MINHVGTVSIFVSDQERAKKFYIEILGFELKADAPLYPGDEPPVTGGTTPLRYKVPVNAKPLQDTIYYRRLRVWQNWQQFRQWQPRFCAICANSAGKSGEVAAAATKNVAAELAM
jgi:catechol 2,3-dioxygenase-like lactoylglutathione lyase family enzyme